MADQNRDFLYELEDTIRARLGDAADTSYTVRLASSGVERIAQKLGEEAVEVALASVCDKEGTAFRNEAADLLYHLLLLLNVRGCSLSEICDVLEARHQERISS